MLSYQIKSSSASSMSGYGRDVEDELAEKRLEHNLEPCVVIMNKVETESDKRNSATNISYHTIPYKRSRRLLLSKRSKMANIT